MTSLQTRRLKHASMMALMFVFGLFTGIGLTVLLAGRLIERYLDAPQVDAQHTLLRRAIARHVELDEAEERAVNDALDAHRDERARLLRGHEIALTPVRRATFATMRAKMRPHNRIALDAYLKKLEARRFARHEPVIDLPVLEPARE